MTAFTRAVLVALPLMTGGTALRAQVPSTPPQATSEDLEPRTIGTTGTMVVGFAGYVDKILSSERTLPTNYTAQIDVARFLSSRFVARGGLAGSGSFGGEDAEERPAGVGAPALHGFGALFYYFTPQSIASLYIGGEYWAQLTQRADPDAGSIVSKAGVQGAVSSRVHVFLEAGYGIGLTREEETTSRFIGQLGIRLKF